jgi:molecular chaperone IbpA
MRTTNVSFGPIWPSSVGFDNIIGELDALLNAQAPTSTFPPHNIIKVDDYNYVVELAIAGFSKEDIQITLKDGQLEIRGSNPVGDDNDVQYLHKGIGTRSFVKTIKLADTVEVRGAVFKDGILKIGLENVVPESKKPRTIEIMDSLTPSTGIDRVRELLVEKEKLEAN